MNIIKHAFIAIAILVLAACEDEQSVMILESGQDRLSFHIRHDGIIGVGCGYVKVKMRKHYDSVLMNIDEEKLDWRVVSKRLGNNYILSLVDGHSIISKMLVADTMIVEGIEVSLDGFQDAYKGLECK